VTLWAAVIRAAAAAADRVAIVESRAQAFLRVGDHRILWCYDTRVGAGHAFVRSTDVERDAGVHWGVEHAAGPGGQQRGSGRDGHHAVDREAEQEVVATSNRGDVGACTVAELDDGAGGGGEHVAALGLEGEVVGAGEGVHRRAGGEPAVALGADQRRASVVRAEARAEHVGEECLVVALRTEGPGDFAAAGQDRAAVAREPGDPTSQGFGEDPMLRGLAAEGEQQRVVLVELDRRRCSLAGAVEADVEQREAVVHHGGASVVSDVDPGVEALVTVDDQHPRSLGPGPGADDAARPPFTSGVQGGDLHEDRRVCRQAFEAHWRLGSDAPGVEGAATGGDVDPVPSGVGHRVEVDLDRGRIDALRKEAFGRSEDQRAGADQELREAFVESVRDELPYPRVV